MRSSWLALIAAACAVAPLAQARRRRGGSSDEADSPYQLARVEEIQQQVAEAGGNAKGMFAISLSWATHDDLDLHVIVPGGGHAHAHQGHPNQPQQNEIFYGRRQMAGGELDVDMCVQGYQPPSKQEGRVCTDHPVENVVFPRNAPTGVYKIYVQNFGYHPSHLASGENRPIKFEVVIKMGKKTRLFSGLCTRPRMKGPPSNVRVYEFTHLGRGRVSRIYAADPMENCEIQRIGAGPKKKKRKKSSGRINAPPGGGSSGSRGGSQRQSGRSADAKKKKKKKPAARFTKEELEGMRVRKLKRTLKDYGGKCPGCTLKEELIEAVFKVAGREGDGDSRNDEL